MDRLDINSPFIIYRLPGEKTQICRTDVTASGDGLDAGDIHLSQWLGATLGIQRVDTVSTPRPTYSAAVKEAAARAAARNGKTVLARTVCGSFHRFAPLEMAREYFKAFPSMFCFLAYHPRTGYWMSASPELLAVFDGKNGDTRALAGTRKAVEATPWDNKNVAEHEMVVKDIKQRIRDLGPDWSCIGGDRSNLRYGNIEHLCTPISFAYSGDSPAQIGTIVNTLHPTPAVGGFPRAEALADIAELEIPQRKFYGGVISTPSTAYVVLRCVHFDRRHWCIYTGSGITGLSTPDAEWDETEAKAQPLLMLLNQF